MRHRVVWMAGCAIIASPASGSFVAVLADFGDTVGSDGTPIPVVGGSLFSFAAGAGSTDPSVHNVLAPTQGVNGAGIGMVGVNPSAPSHVPGTNAINPFGDLEPVFAILADDTFPTTDPTQIQGIWFIVDNMLSSGTSPVGFDGMWLGRFGVTQGATLDLGAGEGVVALLEPGETLESIVVASDEWSQQTLDGAPPTKYYYRLRTYSVATEVTLESGQTLDVFDLWIEQNRVPGPATPAALCMLGAFGRRRRS